MVTQTTLQKLATAIPTTRPFRISELSARAGLSRPTTRFGLHILRQWGYVRRLTPLMGRRRWVVTRKWNAQRAVDDYHYLYHSRKGDENDTLDEGHRQ